MMSNDPDMATNILERQAKWLDRYSPELRINELGKVISVGDGITWISGLPSAAIDDVLAFEDGSQAMVFDLTEGLIGAVLLHDTAALTAGATVQHTGRSLSVPVGDNLLGRIIDPLGTPLDGKPPPVHTLWQALESSSPPIVARDFVNEPLHTGQDVNCVYVLIGQKRSTVVNTIDTLDDYGALDFTTVVVAEAGSLPGLQHLAPFAGCAVAEFWMQQGRDVLVIYDDLSTHAKTYRELSLLLRRPPGREAYPGDIFSVHARLLERATCLNPALGGGSMTALPIVETQLGEIAAYIPTNLISITDGQLYLDHSLFVGGFRPAIDIARSVSRIGGQAQHPRIKEEAGRMKLDYLQFLELEVFTRFGARLESSMEAAIHRGRLLREILKQNRLSPLPVAFQMAWLVAFNDGHFEETDPDTISALLATLEEPARLTTLNLDAPREEWSAAVANWLSLPTRDGPT